MYKCNECGRTFDEPAEWRESRGEFWGQTCYENMIGCPHCYGSDYEEYTGDEDEEKENDDDE